MFTIAMKLLRASVKLPWIVFSLSLISVIVLQTGCIHVNEVSVVMVNLIAMLSSYVNCSQDIGCMVLIMLR